MITHVQKWGNSLALRIPKLCAAQLGLEENGAVDLSIENGCLIVMPHKESLDILLSAVNECNLHREVDMGSPMGNEVW
jgi:antitoxin MazE